MGNIVENLKRYIETAPKDELDEIFQKYGNVGPTIDEYAKSVYDTIDNSEMKKMLEQYI